MSRYTRSRRRELLRRLRNLVGEGCDASGRPTTLDVDASGPAAALPIDGPLFGQ